MPKHITRRDLDKLADEELFAVARNRKATRRMDAIRILIQRCSAFIRRREIARDVEALLTTPPQKH